jgi:hypothetical protein
LGNSPVGTNCPISPVDWRQHMWLNQMFCCLVCANVYCRDGGKS